MVRDSKNLIVGLDIGTSKIVAIVAEITADGGLNVIGMGTQCLEHRRDLHALVGRVRLATGAVDGALGRDGPGPPARARIALTCAVGEDDEVSHGDQP